MASASTHKQVDSHGDAHNAGGSIALYLAIFVALIVLLFASVGMAYIKTEHRDLLTTLGFGIATIKAVLIILFFMHVKFGSKLTQVFALGSFFFLLVMVGLTLNDYETRIPVVKSEEAISGPAERYSAEGYKEPAKDYPAHSDSNYGK